MKKKAILTSIIVIAAFIGASAQATNIDTSKAETLRLDLKSASGISVSKIFDEVKFIPLETIAQSLFGEISQLEVAKDCYIISDQDTRSILIFNLNGSFRTRIKLEKPVVQAFPIEFKLIENSKNPYLQVLNGSYQITYDLNGKLIKKVDAKSVDDGKTTFYFLAESITVKSNYEVNNNYYEIALLKDGIVIGSYFPHEKDYTRHDQYMSSGANLTSSSFQNVFYKRPYDYGIYRITPNGMSLDYKLIFPSEYSVPNDFLSNKEFVNKRIDFLQKNRKVFYGLKNVYKSGSNLFFSGASLDLSKSHKRDFIFNLKTRNLISIQDIEPDILSSYLPITNLTLNPDFAFHGFHLYKNDYLYNSIPSIDMMALKTQSPNKDFQYNDVLTTYFKTQNKKSNPVLVVLKPKKD